MSQEIERVFPKLVSVGYRIISPATPRYNCIAWAVGEDNVWWWPDPMGQGFWPGLVPRQETVDAFTRLFEILGYTRSDTTELEPGFEKIAIYVDDTGTPKHAARQLPNGEWTSKLGRLEDIEHTTLEGLTSSQYGSVRLILKRKR